MKTYEQKKKLTLKVSHTEERSPRRSMYIDALTHFFVDKIY